MISWTNTKRATFISTIKKLRQAQKKYLNPLCDGIDVPLYVHHRLRHDGTPLGQSQWAHASPLHRARRIFFEDATEIRLIPFQDHLEIHYIYHHAEALRTEGEPLETEICHFQVAYAEILSEELSHHERMEWLSGLPEGPGEVGMEPAEAFNAARLTQFYACKWPFHMAIGTNHDVDAQHKMITRIHRYIAFDTGGQFGFPVEIAPGKRSRSLSGKVEDLAREDSRRFKALPLFRQIWLRQAQRTSAISLTLDAMRKLRGKAGS